MVLAALILMPSLGKQAFALSGGGGEETIPIPSKDFSVVVEDAKNVQTVARKVTWNGKIFIEARRGSSEVTIPFEKTQSIHLTPGKPDRDNFIPATIKLKNGETVEVKIDSRSKCYGETDFGTFKIYARDLVSVTFQ